MNRLILFFVLTGFGISFSQTTRLVFGPLVDDLAGDIETYENAAVDVDLWIRTEPGIRLVGMHLPLSTINSLISDRNGGSFENYLENWVVTEFQEPEDDPHHSGYTNQSIMAVCDDPSDAVETNGEWWKIATYKMTADAPGLFDTLFCGAFIRGYSSVAGELILADFDLGELDSTQYELDFACLEFEHFCGGYIPGDYNGNGTVNLADLITALSYLQTCSPEAAVMCQCPPGRGEEFAVAFDLNNTCTFDLIDCFLFMEIFPNHPELAEPCEYCAPAG